MIDHSHAAPTAAGDLDEDVASRPFWDGLRVGRLLVPVCAQGHRFFPPMPGCPVCGSTSIELTQASGRGRVYSWATVEIALSPALEPDAPYTVLVVDLEEGGRLMGRLLDAPSGVGADVPVQLETYTVGDKVMPGFRWATG